MILFGTQDADHKPTQMRGFEMALPEQPQEEKRDGRKRERKNGRTNQMSGFGSGRGTVIFFPNTFYDPRGITARRAHPEV